MRNFNVIKAEEIPRKLRIGFSGPPGSGKTYAALAIAKGFCGPDARILFADSERRVGAYVDFIQDFGDRLGVIDMSEDMAVDAYSDLVLFAEREGYTLLIIDSMSHAWVGTGGALEEKDDAIQGAGGNSYYAWRGPTKKLNRLTELIHASRVHIIMTFRSKTEYAEETHNGRKTYKKVGTSMIYRGDFDYELDLFGEVDLDHTTRFTKSVIRGIGLPEPPFDMVVTPELGKLLKSWVEAGKVEPQGALASMIAHIPHTKTGLIAVGKMLGIDANGVGQALKEAGMEFLEERWDDMVASVQAWSQAQKAE